MNELPNDSETLQALVLEQKQLLQRQQDTIANLQDELNNKLAKIEQIKNQLATLKRQQFGRCSEKVKRTIQQVAKRLNELQEECIQLLAPPEPGVPVASRQSPLPTELPREEQRLSPEHMELFMYEQSGFRQSTCKCD